MKTVKASGNSAESKNMSPVLVLFDDDAARKEAVKLCDGLIHRFWQDHEFEVSWCSFGSLRDPQSGQRCSTKASGADLVIFAASGHLPGEMKSWIDDWIRQRGEREGVLIDVCGSPDTTTSDTQLYLRSVAHRAGMDYLTQVPQTLSWCIPDSPESYRQRAHTMTSVLHEILRH
jgi:hypothetical protein